MNERDEQRFERRLTREMRERADAPLPPDVAARLESMRREAVAHASSQTPARSASNRGWPMWGGIGAATAAAAVLVVVGMRPDPAATPLPYLDAGEFAAAQELELLEDLEFLAWLDAEEAGGAG